MKRLGEFSLGPAGPAAWDLVPPLPPHWVRYRHGFVVLQHMYSLADGSPEAELAGSCLSHDLGFSTDEGEAVVRYLQFQGYLRCPGIRLALTPRAVRYLEAGCGRRRSVRPN